MIKINWFKGLVIKEDGSMEILDLTKPKGEQVAERLDPKAEPVTPQR